MKYLFRLFCTVACLAVINFGSGAIGELTAAAEFSTLRTLYGKEFKSSYDECGGVIKGLVGGITYKLYEPLPVSTTCVWTILVPRKSAILVRVVESNLARTFHGIEIYNTPNALDSQLKHAVHIEEGDRKVHNITGGSLIQIVFWSRWYQTNRTGFALAFEGTGTNVDTSDYYYRTYNVLDHTSATKGLIQYPATGTSFPNLELFLLTISPQKNKKIALTLENFLYFEGSSLMDIGCLSTNKFVVSELHLASDPATTRLSVCKKTQNSTTIYSNVHLVVSFISFQPQGTGSFQFSWEMI